MYPIEEMLYSYSKIMMELLLQKGDHDIQLSEIKL